MEASTPPTLAAGYTRPGQVEELRVRNVAQLAGRPVAVDDRATGTAPEMLVDVLANDFATDGSELRITAPPAHGSAAVAGGKIRYTPDPGFAGEDGLTYALCVGQGCAPGCNGACSEAALSLGVAPVPTDEEDPGGGQPGGPVAGGSPAGPARRAAGRAAPDRPHPRLGGALGRPRANASRPRSGCGCDAPTRAARSPPARGCGGRRSRDVRRSIGRGGSAAIRVRLTRAQRAAAVRALRRGRRVTVRVLVTVRHQDGTTQRLTTRVRLRLR